MKGVLASVVDGVNSGTLVKIDGSLGLEPEVVLVPNLESDFAFDPITGTITGYAGTRKDVVIPSTINSVAVKVIGTNSFRIRGITSVYIPDGVTSIGKEAFYVNGLTSVRLPKTLVSIGVGAFRGNKLTVIDFPNSLTSISSDSFRNNKLTSVYIPSGVTALNDGEFAENLLITVEMATGTTYRSVTTIWYSQTFQFSDVTITYY